MRWLALIIACVLPLLLLAQDTIVPGTFTVRKVYQGDVIPDGLGVFGNMGGTRPGGGSGANNLVIKGKVMRTNGIDTVPMRSAQVTVLGTALFVTTDESGVFRFTIDEQLRASMESSDSLTISTGQMDGWQMKLTVPMSSNATDYVITRFVADNNTGRSTMGRKQRRREMLKRIFLPWVWFKKKEKLPPREKLVFTKGSTASIAPNKLQVLSQLGD